MARYKRGARSQAIRDYFKEHPKAGINEVVEALKAGGIKVSTGLVSNIKYGKPGKKKRRGGRGGANSSITASQLMEAKKMADALGGVAQARIALDTLQQLQ